MGCWQGGEALPTPQMLHPNTSRCEDATQWLCLDRQVSPSLLSAAPDQYKTTGRTQPFCPWGRDPSVTALQSHPGGIRAGTGCDTELCDHGLRGAPTARPCIDEPSGVKNKRIFQSLPAHCLLPGAALSVNTHHHSQTGLHTARCDTPDG